MRLSQSLRRFGVTGIVAALAVALVLPLASGRSVAAQGGTQDIVATAQSAGQFTTLTQALQAAGLVDTLKGPGPYTVFAPTDEAFAKLPPGTVEALLQNPERLRAVLTYHVVPGQVMAAEAMQVDSAQTVQGESLMIKTSGNSVMVNNATVVNADVMASNGVIHVIDTVLMPPSMAPASMPRSGGVADSLLVTLGAAAFALGLGGIVLRRTRLVTSR